MPAEPFGTAPDGSPVSLVTLRHGATTARLMTWGASLQDLRLDPVPHSLVLGSPDFAAYLSAMPHFGAIAGPVANRIAGGRAPLDGEIVELERNENGINMLHGGTQGTSLSNWTLAGNDGRQCRFEITVPDGIGGLPGPISLMATYAIDDDGALVLDIEGRSAKPTFCAPAHHSYWCLDGSGSIGAHHLTIAADTYLPVDDALIPLGNPAPVAGTRFDFRAPRDVIAPGDRLLDHNFCLRPGAGMRPVATLRAGAIELTVASDQPGLQVYDGTGIGPVPGHDGRTYGANAGLALEPQHWPDAPNHPGYPPVVLMPGAVYRQRSRFHARHIPPAA